MQPSDGASQSGSQDNLDGEHDMTMPPDQVMADVDDIPAELPFTHRNTARRREFRKKQGLTESSGSP
jgi:hypothetical protein